LQVSKPGKITLSDELALRLFLSLRTAFGNDLRTAREAYVAKAQESGAPDWAELERRGWIQVCWGRLQIPLSVVRYPSADAENNPPLRRLLDERFREQHRFVGDARSCEELVSVIEDIERGSATPQDIGCQSPRWVAARLWDRTILPPAVAAEELRQWVDRWTLLGNPAIVPHLDWQSDAATAFVESALSVLRTETPEKGWERRREAIIGLYSANLGAEEAIALVPPLPTTLVDRAHWLQDPRIVQATDPWDNSDIIGLVRLLLADVRTTDYAAPPQVVARQLFELARERPAVFDAVILQCDVYPVLLADLILHPPTCALACYLIGRRALVPGAWDRALLEPAMRADQLTAFTDAVSILGDFLEKGSSAPAEVASLFTRMHEAADRIGNNREMMLSELRRAVAKQSPERIKGVVVALLGSARFEFGSPEFAAALDVVASTSTSNAVDGPAFVRAYVDAIRDGDYSLTAHRIASPAAAALLTLGTNGSPEVRDEFLYPLPSLESARTAGGDNPHMLKDQMARSIRAHVRVLCRGVDGRDGDVPDATVDALVAAIRRGSRDHQPSGSVDAFAARYETAPYRRDERPIAADLAAAITALDGSRQDRVLHAVLDIDEPLTLAQMAPLVSQDSREKIHQRLEALTPERSGEIYSLRDVQARIEALLSEGSVDVATLHMDEEAKLQTLGRPPGRELARLTASLRLKLLQQKWADIEATTLPDDLLPIEIATAQDTIAFFKGVGALISPEGNRVYAEAIFQSLHSRRPDVVAYAANLFAAQISILLGGDIFDRIREETAAQAQAILDEAENSFLSLQLSIEDADAFDGNRAVLLLALGRPERALEIVGARVGKSANPWIVASASVALSRLGRGAEATAALQEAIQRFGERDILKAARDRIAGRAAQSTAGPNVIDETDPIPGVKQAIGDLLNMDPSQQARVLLPGDRGFEDLVTRYVRLAASSLVEIAPFMKNVGLNSREPELNALLRQMLLGHLSFLRWSVNDESKGGFTAKGNPGERDLVIGNGTSTLAVIEAVVCDRPVTQEWTRENLTNHFQKLIGYSTCGLFYHVTYADIDDQQTLLPLLGTSAEEQAPQGFVFLDREDISSSDSQPNGFRARYRCPTGITTVVFLILDLRQHAQRSAAKTAEENNPRRKKSQTKKTPDDQSNE
jgi:hypothetical protein